MTSSFTAVLAVTRLPPAALAAFRDRLPNGWSLVLLDATGRCGALADRRTRVIATTAIPAVSRADCAGWPGEQFLCMSDDGLLCCPTAPDFPVAEPAGCLVWSKEALPADGGDCYHAGSFARPEHFLGPVLIASRHLAALAGGDGFRFDRWLGHQVMLRALRAGGTAGRLDADWPVIPSIGQTSGRDLRSTRLWAGPVIETAIETDLPGLGPGWRRDARCCGEDANKLDACLSSLTRILVEQLPAALPATPPASLPRDATLAVIKLDPIGDAVLVTPFLRALRHRHGGEIRYLGSIQARPLLENCPYVDRFLFIDGSPALLDPRSAPDHLERWLPEVRVFLSGVDAVVIPRLAADLYFAMPYAVLSGVPRLFGLTGAASADLPRYNACYAQSFTDPVSIEVPCHEVTALGKLADRLGVGPIEPRCEVFLTQEDHATAKTLAAIGGLSRRRIAFGLGAQSPRRRWPAEYYAAVADALCAAAPTTVYLLGGDDVAEDARAIADRLGSDAVNLCGRTTLRETAAILARLDGFIGNDSSAMHLAAAVGIPTIEISCHPRTGAETHENAPLRFGPLTGRAIVLQPAHPHAETCRDGCVALTDPHCILGVSVAQAIDACQTLFGPDLVRSGIHHLTRPL